MQFPFLGLDQYVQLGGAAAQASNPLLTDLDTGSVELALIQAAAQQAVWEQFLISLAYLTERLSTSTGSDCDSFGADFGFTRLQGIASTGSVTLNKYNVGQVAVVPVGTTLKTSDGTQAFIVTTDPTNAAYDGVANYVSPATSLLVSVPVQAVVAGSAGNVAAGTITLATSPMPGIDYITGNALPLVNGVDAESDASFRSRFINFINSRDKGTLAAVAYAIQSTQQGLSFEIVENTTPAGTARAGFFSVYVDDGTGHPSSALLASIYGAIDAVRPVGQVFAVNGPVLVPATVVLTIVAAAGYSKPLVQANVAAAVTSYFASLTIGQPAMYLRVAQVILDAQGVGSIASGTLTLNGSTADLGGTGAQTVRLSSVVVN